MEASLRDIQRTKALANKACQLSPTALVGNSLTGNLVAIDVVECTEASGLAALERSAKIVSAYINSLGASILTVLESVNRCQPSQFAGYCSNIEFWLSEAEHFHAVVDSYEERFARMQKAAVDFKRSNHGARNFDDTGHPYQDVVRTLTSGEGRRICSEVRHGLQKFIERAYSYELIDEASFFSLEGRILAMA